MTMGESKSSERNGSSENYKSRSFFSFRMIGIDHAGNKIIMVPEDT